MLLQAAVGLLVGGVMAALGGGGAVLTVPALVHLLGYRPYAAGTASLVVVITTAVAGAVIHARGGRLRAAPGIAFGLLGVPAAWFGSRLAAHVPDRALTAVFAVLLLAAAGALLHRGRSRAASDRAGDEAGDRAGHGTSDRASDGARRRPVRPLAVAVAATGVGLLTGTLGVGGGFLVVPALVLTLGFTQRDATGTSLLAIAVTSAAALGGRSGQLSGLDWPAVGLLAGGALAGAVAGAWLSGRLDPARLRAAFAGLLLTVAGATLVALVR